MIVVDASALVPALVDDGPDGDRARARLHGQVLVVPELLDLEVSSVLRRLLQAGRVPVRRAELALSDLIALPVRRVAHRALLSRIWELRDNATAYDAAYLALAERLGTVLVTADIRLSRVPGVTCEVDVLVTT